MGDLSIEEGDSTMDGNKPTRDGAGQIDRRTILKLTGSAAAATVAASGAATARGRMRGKGNSNGGGGKSGGRGQTSDPVELDEPFTVEHKKKIKTNASCMSSNSEQVHYHRYFYEYCNIDVEPSDEDDERKTFCVRPGKTKLDEDRVYEFHSKQECKASSKEFQHKFSFGPSNSAHDC